MVPSSSYTPRTVQQEREQTVQQAFRQFSEDGSTLTRHEFKCAYVCVFGVKPSRVSTPPNLPCMAHACMQDLEAFHAPLLHHPHLPHFVSFHPTIIGGTGTVGAAGQGE